MDLRSPSFHRKAVVDRAGPWRLLHSIRDGVNRPNCLRSRKEHSLPLMTSPVSVTLNFFSIPRDESETATLSSSLSTHAGTSRSLSVSASPRGASSIMAVPGPVSIKNNYSISSHPSRIVKEVDGEA